MIELDILNQRRGSKRVKSLNSLCLVEYEWPLRSQQYNILQEHLSRFLNVKALHRRFEELERRNVENDEKQYLLENGLIHPVEANFRLVALKYQQILKFLKLNFPDKYHLYLVTLKNREITKIARDQCEFKSKTNVNDADILYETALLDTVRFNSLLLKEKDSSRFYSIDLQSFVLCWPQKAPQPNIKFVNDRDSYPISLIPNQYQTYLPKYTPDQLNILLHRPEFSKSDPEVEEIGKEQQAENNTSFIKTTRKRGRKPKIVLSPKLSAPIEMMDVEVENPEEFEDSKEDIICSECLKSSSIGEQNFITCTKCDKKYHAICMDVSLRLIEKVGFYDWSCYYCKKCVICNVERKDVDLLLCETCDKPYHLDCIKLDEIPIGRWVCKSCGVCASCLKRRPTSSGWCKEMTSIDGVKKLVQIHCAKCSKKFNNREYCPVCLEVHWNPGKFRYCSTCIKCKMTVHEECMQPKTKMCMVCSGLVAKRFSF